MTTDETVASFARIYVGDSLMKALEIQTEEAICRVTFHSGSLLSHAGATIFEPVARYSPAVLIISKVHELRIEGRYQLNATVVDFDARPLPGEDQVEFSFVLTGGTDPDAFMVTLRIVGERFTFGPA